MFVLLKSRVHFPDLDVRLLEGWHPVEQAFRWTKKAFSIEIVLPLERSLTSFSLPVIVPDALIMKARWIGLSCTINGSLVGSSRYDRPGTHVFEGILPEFSLHEPVLKLSFEVHSDFEAPLGDERQLGVCVPIGSSKRNPIDFQVFF
jgi:hypothetical protein